MQSKATTVNAYLAELPPDRQVVITAVRDGINRAIPKGFVEQMIYGMIGWCVPLSTYPAGYHCDPAQPLSFIGLAAQKNAYSLYLSCLYHDDELLETFKADWAKTGKKLDMGKSCIRFKKLDDLPLEIIGKMVARVSVKDYIARYEAVTKDRVAPRKTGVKKSTAARNEAAR